MPNVFELFREISLFAKLTMAVPAATLGVAVLHVFRPTEQKLALMRPLSLASIFATISGLFAGWIAVLGGIAATADGTLPTSSMFHGIAESLVVGFASFGALAAGWLLVAAAVMRRPAELLMSEPATPIAYPESVNRASPTEDGS